MIRFSSYLNRAKMPIFTVGNIVYKSGKSEVLRPLWGAAASRVQRVQRVAVSPSTMSFIVSVTGFTLCHQCCTTKSKSPPSQGRGWRWRRRRIGASGLFKIFRTYPQGSAQLLSEKGACTTSGPMIATSYRQTTVSPTLYASL